LIGGDWTGADFARLTDEPGLAILEVFGTTGFLVARGFFSLSSPARCRSFAAFFSAVDIFSLMLIFLTPLVR
jgi:hypothetical protein